MKKPLLALLLCFGATLSAQTLKVITPQVLELTYSTVLTNTSQLPAPLWLGIGGPVNLPQPTDFQVLENGTPSPVLQIGAVRRAASAQKKQWSSVMESRVFLVLSNALSAGSSVTVSGVEVNPVTIPFDEFRRGPVLHVNPIGFVPDAPKLGFLGYWLGSLGELPLTAWQNASFDVVREADGQVLYTGSLQSRPDVGFNAPMPYQQVLAADFSTLTNAGTYFLRVTGMGRSSSFRIGPEIAAAAARTYSLGLTHQRSGFNLAWPDTRFTRPADHVAPAEIPTGAHPTNPLLAASSSDFSNNPRHTAPQLANATNSLFPFLQSGPVDVAGGHHDAGDYSKYTINSAQLIHHLGIAARHFPGAGILDGLGTPESGDGVGDLWQMAEWEAGFLAKLQDTDGGFAFLVYPRARRYEDNVMPEQGDLQVLWPKNTAATAAATAALAELAAAPGFADAFPQKAAQYRDQALLGWSFLTNAIQTYGKDGSYQKLTHYGDVFMHDDELCWAAAALFALTGEPEYETQLKAWMPDPANRSVRRWSWWRLYGSYGNAIRCLALNTNTGDPAYREVCRLEVLNGGLDQATRSAQNAYGLSFPAESKRFYSAGWFFGSMPAFDALVALQVNPSPSQNSALRSAVWNNLGYEWGANPGNRSYITGWGPNFPLQPVSQQAENDTHYLPPTGQMVGCLQSGMSWLSLYGTNLSRFTYPADSLTNSLRFPLYDRFTDMFNTSTEFTVVEQSAGVAVTSGLLAAAQLPPNSGRGMAGTLVGASSMWNQGEPNLLTLSAPGIDFAGATVMWEWAGGWTNTGSSLTLVRPAAAGFTIQAEATLPDGQRVYGRLEIPSINQPPQITVGSTNQSLALPTSSLKLTTTVQDDHFPGFPLSLGWSLVAGPSLVNFTDPTNPVTSVSLGAPGTYQLRLSATDTEFTTEKDLFLTVTGEMISQLGLAPSNALAVYRFSSANNEATNAWHLALEGNATLVPAAGFWGSNGGGVLRTRSVGDQVRVVFPDLIEGTNAAPIVWEARILARQFKAYGISDAPIVSLRQDWDSNLEVVEGKWNTAARPFIRAGTTTLLSSSQWLSELPLNTWVRLRLVYEPALTRASLFVNGSLRSQVNVNLNASRTTNFTLLMGNFDGDIDEVGVWRE